jgi:hypothetical protein
MRPYGGKDDDQIEESKKVYDSTEKWRGRKGELRTIYAR